MVPCTLLISVCYTVFYFGYTPGDFFSFCSLGHRFNNIYCKLCFAKALFLNGLISYSNFDPIRTDFLGMTFSDDEFYGSLSRGKRANILRVLIREESVTR